MSVLTRIKAVALTDFRGWGHRDGGLPRQVDTDADIVLVTGANGYGKSTLLEAILMVLTGHRENRPPTGDDAEWSQLAHRAADRWSIRLTVAREESADSEIGLEWRRGVPEPTRSDHWRDWLDQRMAPYDPTLFARAISFFQDDPRGNLDEGAHHSTLVRFLRPVAPELEKLQRTLRELKDALGQQAARAEGRRRELGAPSPELAPSALRYAQVVAASLPESVPALRDPEELGDWLARTLETVDGRDVAPAIPRPDLTLELTAAVRRKVGTADPDALRRVEDDLADVDRELRHLPPETAAVEVLRWAGEDDAEPVPVDRLLRRLAEQLDRWRREAPADPGLAPLVHELRQLDMGALGTLAAATEAVVEPARVARERRRALEQRKVELVSEQARLMSGVSPLLDDASRALVEHLRDDDRRLFELARVPDPLRLRDGLRQLAAVEQALEGALAGGPTGTLEAVLNQTLDATLVRFQPREGLLPIRLRERRKDEKTWNVLTTADGRPWTDLSTGQKAQLGLAWMLAQAQALRNKLPARVLLLDDTSTAFDQGNLARQATWLRQLAYHPDPQQRWQTFLASHHDELTHRLVQLLRPPEGRKLQILDFVGWTPEVGPVVKPWVLQLAKPVWPGSPAERLAEGIHRIWHRPKEKA